MRHWLLAVGCMGAWFAAARAQERYYPLNEGWSFCRAGTEQWRSAEVPGVVQADLLRHGLIPDFMQGSNIDSVQWVEGEDWIYRRMLFVADTLLQHEHLDLVFKGLDTFAEVHLNDSLIGTADNMFRTWEWDIRKALRKGWNELKVVFRSPIKQGAKLREAYGIQLPHDSDPSGVSPYIRKAAYQFGWDFCPRLVTSGIWKGVELRAWSGARIAGATVRWNGDHVRFVPWMDARPRSLRRLRCEVLVDGRRVATARADRAWKLAATVPVTDLPEWFPAGMGPRPVKAMVIRLMDGGKELSRYQAPFARVSHALVQGSDSLGTSFTFAVNGRPYFAKGCNLIPPHLVPSAITDSAWIAQVRHMQRAGMNMVRIWAGGIYPPDAFYSACDTAGIVVWQDFMLANLVPAEGGFHRNLLDEAWEQAHRIQHHPSVALLCGNNELRVAWHHWGWQDRYGLHGPDSARVILSNEKLWQQGLAGIAESLGAGRYVPTSPLSNWGSSIGLRHGDLHYWGVWHGDSTFSSFKNNVGRFVSEWGFQSYPDSALLARYNHPESLHLGSPEVKRLQRSYKTDRPIWEAIELDLGEDRPTNLGSFIEASQRAQAKAYRMAIEAHMAARPNCMGTLLWQLNDCWPGPSWSIIDFAGRPKPAYEEVKQLFARP